MTPASNLRSFQRPLTALAVTAWMLAAQSASAEVVRQGTWPKEDPKVSLSVDSMPRGEAVKRLADEAGWSVVLDDPPSSRVSVAVKDQPATKVLDLLLSDGRYFAKRDGSLISIRKDPDAVQPAGESPDAGWADAAPAKPDEEADKDDEEAKAPEPESSAAAAPSAEASDDAAPPASSGTVTRRGEDRVVTGGSTRVAADEVVHDLVVMGGSAEVLGTVTGDLVVMGGSATVKKGALVKGDASVVGGSLDIDDGATVEGDVGVVGGKLNRGGKSNIKLKLDDDHEEARGFIGWLSDFAGSVTRVALLFVFGTVLLALATNRMEAMQGEVAARPMRTFALGVVSVLVGALAFVVLCVTLVGIPIALVAVILGVIGTYAGICAALTTLGAALIQHKTKSPYVHLALGCVLFLLASSLPWIGGFVTAGVVLVGLGALVATRGAGFFVRRAKNEGPYRTAAAT